MEPPAIEVGTAKPCLSVVVTGNYFNPASAACGDAYATLASFGTAGLIFEANDCGACAKLNPKQTCVPARGLANASESRFGLNTGSWTA